ncbi:MAG: LacI family transcriptional regulator [Tepidanaerobacter acetatoxydans]|uniref:LacI family DNA-binding transcriptional regulator n=1 Tax=Tepidanaerobacter acetatoxydans TaxID=499229 RepID=UPI0026F24408|nr:LacI family DNA-binding transcriptional regulator [Tepidanaerobacter acetatoxydans]NLU10649.1 LacI family transcriptional regulator [Tepidanaerobacter acetatoxydans]
MEVTIKDIAKVAGVSKSTVSRVLSNSGKFSEESKQKVLEAAKKLNYTKNAVARAMITKETKNIGLIVYQKHKPILSHPFYAPVIESIVDNSMKLGYSIIIATDQDIKGSSAELLLEKRVDGIIFASFIDPSIVLKYKEQNIPLVLVNNSVDFKGVSYIKFDNFKGAFEAVSYLISKKHKNIGLLSGPLEHQSYKERLRGYMSALKENGLIAKEKNIRVGNSTLSEGFRLMKELLNESILPTAVFASNDMMAIGAIKAIKSFNLRVPEDIAVIGFDNIDYGRLIEPSLSTIDADKDRMGKKAVELLIKEINKYHSFRRENILPTKLVIRKST